ncbi:hypothetical protein DIURU_001500 [Diutina rugosa]|uniref:Fcf2 pre-rRNA processing C-terminal domain-containing protein n=1 Tax=Diutina rugosa TaxID=5481 RepID=A0A642V0P2_DIURU|nr:uncharacterized protein DIURU_001500 [Diutina rugosa]KAA8905427.1 hypothetical protein DIURU_001500 [Diutina rugosa]
MQHRFSVAMSLSDLFAELRQETTPATKVDGKDIDQVKKAVLDLPKIEAELEAPAKKQDVVTLNDPLVPPKVKVSQEKLDEAKWFNMKTPEMTADIKRDLLIIKNRAALDPKRFYKKEKWEIPKQFQMGTIIEGNTSYYNKLTRKQRGTTLAQEMLHDEKTQKYLERKHGELEAKRKSIKDAQRKRRRF